MHTLTAGIFNKIVDQPSLSRSRKITPHTDIDLVFVCRHSDHAIVDLVDHTLTNILATFQIDSPSQIDSSFSQLLEDLNTELAGIQLRQSLSGLSLFLGIVSHGQLTFSLIGDDIQGLLVTEGQVDNIFDGMSSDRDIKFLYDSRGQVDEDELVLITSTDVLSLFSKEELVELIDLSVHRRLALLEERVVSSNAAINSAYAIIGYEKGADTHIASTGSPASISHEHPPQKKMSRVVSGCSDLCQKGLHTLQSWFANLPERAQYALFGAGILLALILLYMIISTALGSQKQFFVPKEYEELHASAVVSVQEALNNAGNPEIFQMHIQEARASLKKIEERGILQAKVDDLSTQIASLEKRFNQITTASSYQVQEQYVFSEDEFEFLQVFVHEGKQYYLGTDRIVGPHIIGSSPESHMLPDGVKARFADIDDEGRVYVYTDTQQVFEFQKGNYQTLDVQQVGGWDLASDIQSYNSNIYLLSDDGKQIYKHRKVANGYDGKSLMIQESSEEFGFPVVSFDIDGGVYVFKENSLVDKVFSAPRYERRSIVINQLGTNIFDYDTTLSEYRKIIANDELEYVYILLNGKIWIFQPSSRRFSDVQSLTYIGQVEVPNIDIQDMWLVQDGDVVGVYFGNSEQGIYRIKVSIRDGNVEIL